MTHLGGSWTMATGLDILNDQYGEDEASEVVMTGKREISFSLDMLVKKTETYYASEFRNKVSHDLNITLGDTAAKKLLIDMPTCEIDPSVRDVPESGMVRVTLPGVALGSSGEDEAVLTMV